MNAVAGLRERKKLRTREALAEAALRLFAERGFDGTTVEDVAAAADVSPRTFFRYFTSKEDAVFADHDERTRVLRETLARASADEAVQVSVRRAILALVELQAAGEGGLRRVRLVTQVPALVARSLEHQARWEEIVAEAVAERLHADPDRDVRARIVAGAAFGALRAAMRAWAASDGAIDPAVVASRALDVLDEGFDRALGPEGASRVGAARARRGTARRA